MKNITMTLTKIAEITTDIETNYPELYRNLDENPMTIPSSDQPNVDSKAMQDYLESLEQLLRHHIETHQNKKAD